MPTPNQPTPAQKAVADAINRLTGILTEARPDGTIVSDDYGQSIAGTNFEGNDRRAAAEFETLQKQYGIQFSEVRDRGTLENGLPVPEARPATERSGDCVDRHYFTIDPNQPDLRSNLQKALTEQRIAAREAAGKPIDDTARAQITSDVTKELSGDRGRFVE